MVGSVQVRAGVLEVEIGQPTRRLGRGDAFAAKGSQETLAQRPVPLRQRQEVQTLLREGPRRTDRPGKTAG